MIPPSRTMLLRAPAIAFLLACLPVFAGQVKLAWDPVPGATGYEIHYGTDPANLGATIDVGNRTTYTVSGLADCTDWHFAIGAYDSTRRGPLSAPVADWPRPRVDSVTPAVARQGQQTTLAVVGANFRPSATLDLDNPGVSLQSVTRLDCGRLQAVALVGPAGPGARPARVGSFAVEVTNPSGIRNVPTATLQVQVETARFDVDRSDISTEDRLNGADMGRLTARWGGCDATLSAACPAPDSANYVPDFDFDGNGWIDGEDLALLVMARWGLCWSASDRDFTANPLLHPIAGLHCPTVTP